VLAMTVREINKALKIRSRYNRCLNVVFILFLFELDKSNSWMQGFQKFSTTCSKAGVKW
jgi:hypothetical protein